MNNISSVRDSLTPESIDFVRIDEDDSGDFQTGEHWRFKVISSIRLEKNEKEEVFRLWNSLSDGETARCHVPKFGIRLNYRDHDSVNASICWECNNIYLKKQNEFVFCQFDAKNETSQNLLETVKEKLGEPGGPYNSGQALRA